MNTMGKILVICNLLIACAVLGFILVDFSTRTNWKAYSDALKRQLEVSIANNKPLIDSNATLNRENQQLKSEKAADQTKTLEIEAQYKGDLATEKNKLEDVMIQIKSADLNLQKSQGEVDRLKEEVKGLLTTLGKRESKIVDLEKVAATYKTEAISNKNEANTMQSRNENLVEQLRRLTLELAELRNRGSGEVSSIIRDPNQPNPPTTTVKGKILKIDAKDRSLVELSVGTDHGVNKNHTLEVYRTTPRAEYLGMVRIIDSEAHRSVAKLIRRNLPGQPVQEGDIVASSISP